MKKIKYRDVQKYKYTLVEDYKIKIKPLTDIDIVEPSALSKKQTFISLSASGDLTIHAGYSWDGPSGPTIDTKSWMRGSLVHDALYQLMRQRRISQDCREYADQTMYEICREDGMNKVRAWYSLKGVQVFGASSAAPTKDNEYKIHAAP